ncbi:MAG: hypothetical protein AAGJ28_08670 [Pseudomonadota bacterium]
MKDRTLTSTRWLHRDPPDRQRSHATPADTDGALDWEKATRLAWRPAWSIRSRRGVWKVLWQILRELPR